MRFGCEAASGFGEGSRKPLAASRDPFAQPNSGVCMKFAHPPFPALFTIRSISSLPSLAADIRHVHAGGLGGFGMKAVCVAMLGVVMVAFAGNAKAEEASAKKLVGVWVLSKAGGNLPEGSTVEFTKDGKLAVVVKADKEIKLEGTYKVEKDKLMVKVKLGEEVSEETMTIKKLTDDVLETEDKDKKIDTFKKKK
ncbi:MAG: hypothetical protein C0467_17495 [Planctomycetaceae bacterium]|nr:hypothetical protein [Planctomycetaceae bacterium]